MSAVIPVTKTKTSAVSIDCGPVIPANEIDGPAVELDDPHLYLNRELTWLGFNRRVLNEAADPRTPLLERVKFLAIVSGNLDEFFMKRIGGLKQLTATGHTEPSTDGRTPAQQIADCRELVRRIQFEREAILSAVDEELERNDIGIMQWRELASKQREELRERFIRNIFPLVTPLAMDPGHPFPFISNLALNLLVTMRFPGDDEIRMARVKVPVMPGVSPR
ncbi:MAG: RNA degradosome polyphosphate kinase, partial [Gammaproteobacteria bacterium]|nr:RNA degradosome polyphosphate kinase [Gammaproteobacteria bacterium]